MNTRVRYTVNDVKNNRFFQMPKFLFEGDFKDKLNNDSRVLYSLLRDRHELSLLNNWVNENNEVFFIYSRVQEKRWRICLVFHSPHYERQ